MFIINFPLPFFFFQFLTEPRLLIINLSLLSLPCGILRRQAVPFGLLARVFLRPVRKHFLFVVFIILGASQDILLRRHHPRLYPVPVFIN